MTDATQSARLVGEDLFTEDETKADMFPYADRAIVNLRDDPPSHIRAHLVGPTVAMVAAADAFSATLDRPRGAALLRNLADLLEQQRLAEIPWGPKNPAHKPVLRYLVEQELGPVIKIDEESGGMYSLMSKLEAEFYGAVDTLVDRFEHRVEGADELLLTSFMTQFMLRRLSAIEEPDLAWSTVRDVAVDEGWIEPGSR